jgi:hypothetical protein
MLDLYYVMHVGASATERYLNKNGEFGGFWGSALIFNSAEEAHEASANHEYNTVVVDDNGNIQLS